MKQIYVSLIMILFCVPVLAQTGKDDKPLTAIIKASPESIKAELIKIHSDGYKLCKEQPSQLTFCKTPDKPKRAFIDHIERFFTLTTAGDTTEVVANSEVRRVNVFGGERKLRGMDKHDRTELQELLENLKKLER